MRLRRGGEVTIMFELNCQGHPARKCRIVSILMWCYPQNYTSPVQAGVMQKAGGRLRLSARQFTAATMTTPRIRINSCN